MVILPMVIYNHHFSPVHSLSLCEPMCLDTTGLLGYMHTPPYLGEGMPLCGLLGIHSGKMKRTFLGGE